MTERETILSLLRLGWSERRIALETGHHRATIRRIGGEMAAGQSVPEVATDLAATAEQNVPEVATDSTSERGGPLRSRSACEPHRPFIEAEAGKGRNAAAIFQDLVLHRGYTGAYDAVKRFVGKLRGSQKSVAALKPNPVKKHRSTMAKALRRAIRAPASTASLGCS